MNVLSLFDGMSCGRIALSRANVAVTSYYASEIDSAAISVSKFNWPSIKQLGEISWLRGAAIPKGLDLLLAGSPCQGFSFVGKQLAFDDPRSRLYFEFLRIYRETNPTYFLLENVRMQQRFQDVITDSLGVEPVLINSSLVAAQSRPRLYWTNIPIAPLWDKGAVAADIIDRSNIVENSPGWNDWWRRNSHYQLSKSYSTILNDVTKGVCQTARQVANWNGNLVRNPNGSLRFASVLECERMQTIPDGYTNVASRAAAYKMLGNGWTVDVVAHILKGLKT